jgi:hypothetical protein
VLFNFLSIKISNHGEYFSIEIFRTNVPAIFLGTFGIFRGNSKFVFSVSTISHRETLTMFYGAWLGNIGLGGSDNNLLKVLFQHMPREVNRIS